MLGALGTPVRVGAALVACAIALPFARGLALAVSLVLLVVGAAIAQAEGLWRAWLGGTIALASVLAIVTFAQLLAAAIELGGYNVALVRWLESRLRWRGARLHVAVLSSFILGWVTAGAALVASCGVLARPDDDASERDALVRSSMRGVGAAVAMTPVTGAFGVTIAMTGVAPLTVVLLALPVALLIVALALAAARGGRPQELPAARELPALPDPPSRPLWEAGAAVLVLLALVLGLGAFARLGALYAIVLAILAVSAGWMLLIDAEGALTRWRLLPWQTVRTASSFALFIPAGALAAVVGAGTWHVRLAGALLALSTFVPPTLAIAGSIWLLFQIGIHPAVSIGVIAPAALRSGLASPTLVALAGVMAAGVGVMSSPFGVVAGLASGMTGRGIFRVGVLWHLAFGFLALVLGSLLAQRVSTLLGLSARGVI